MDYTVSAVEVIIKDLKRVCFCFALLMQILYISYLTYALIKGSGILLANAILAALSLIYLAFYIISSLSKKDEVKFAYRQSIRNFRWFKLLMKAFTLGIALYGIYATVNESEITPLSVILTSLMVVAWTIQVIIEAVLFFVIKEKDLFITAIQADIDSITKPIHSVSAAIDKLTGKPQKPPLIPSKKRLFLDEAVSKMREKRKADKESARKEHRKRIRAKFKSIIKKKDKGKHTNDIEITPEEAFR